MSMFLFLARVCVCVCVARRDDVLVCDGARAGEYVFTNNKRFTPNQLFHLVFSFLLHTFHFSSPFTSPHCFLVIPLLLLPNLLISFQLSQSVRGQEPRACCICNNMRIFPSLLFLGLLVLPLLLLLTPGCVPNFASATTGSDKKVRS